MGSDSQENLPATPPEQGAPGETAPPEQVAPRAATPPFRRRPTTPTKAFFGRFMMGHLLAYPVGFMTAVAAMPLAMVFKKDALMSVGAVGAQNRFIRDAAKELSLSALEAAQVELVLETCLIASLVTLGMVHLWSIPWAIGAARAVKNPVTGATGERRGYRLFGWLTAATFVVVGLAGAIGWIWVFSL
jgi:hypothetical protein